jgi:hypothetical protein
MRGMDDPDNLDIESAVLTHKLVGNPVGSLSLRLHGIQIPMFFLIYYDRVEKSSVPVPSSYFRDGLFSIYLFGEYNHKCPGSLMRSKY